MDYINYDQNNNQNFSNFNDKEEHKIHNDFNSVQLPEQENSRTKKEENKSLSSRNENIEIFNNFDNQINTFSSSTRKEQINLRKKKEKEKVLKSLSRGDLSIKYLIFIIILYVIFLITLIIGFILHFDLKLHVTASGILWTFSFIMLVLSIFYTLIYKKIKKSKDPEEKYNLIRYFPL